MSNLSVNRSESETGNHAAALTDVSPFVARARWVFKALVRIFGICILIQVFFAGLALFWDSAQWASHAVFARLLIVVSVLILANSFIARLPRALRWSSTGLFGIIIFIAICAKLPSGVGYLSALHPVLALMLFFGTVSLLKKTDALIKVDK